MTHVPGSNARPDLPLAVVIGAGGLGMAVARRLGQSNRVLLADRSEPHLERQIAALGAEGLDAKGGLCDVNAAGDIAALAARSRELGGAAAVAYVVGLSPSLGTFGQIISTNLVGFARAVAAFEAAMRPGGAMLGIASSSAHMVSDAPELLALIDAPLDEGLLANLAAHLGERASPASAYPLSKKGMVRLCQRKAADWGEIGNRILSLSPGLIATPQGAGEYLNSPGKRKLFDASPLGREATMLEIAGVAAFLLSREASFISGTDILVDGGLIAALGCKPFG